ncbi:DUF285 domain-containing protein [archaeon]|nr:DUF285 domain-containing protein [archaeon]NCP79099.1 DUF285 domain-containing protein [archaeon]NCP97519.1 DUF285 domain-containing protein [archaeon]NCQ06866.1 DUF285 domain-containing protein [archaeon]NCQ50662.1 DUF285 domain-containing protein [archaeon]
MKKEVKKIKSKKIIKSKKVKKVDKDMNKSKKAQVSLEMIIIIGVLILGAVILATILIGFTNEKVDQAGEIDAATNSTIDGFIKDLTNPEDYEPISGVGSNCVLTLSSNPPAGGTVSGAGTFSCGTSVTATATALSGYTFNNWTTPTGSLSTNPYTFNLNSNTSLTANFSSTAPSTYTLNVSLSGAGNGTVTSNPSGINCGTNCSENYSSGTSVTLTANPVTGHSFGGWSGACSGTNLTCTVSMTQARNVTATFNLPNSYTLNLTKTIGGTVETYPSGINCLESQTNCSATFPDQQSVQLNATPVSGYVFEGWSGDCSGPQISCSVSMTEVKNVTATFSLPVAYNLNLIENPDSVNISLNGAGNYNPGDVANISVSSIAEFSYVNWIDQNGTVVSTDPSFSYTMPSSNVNLTANFIPTSDAFISKWDTTKISTGSSNANQITLPLDSASLYSNNYNFKVYWGDGTTSEVTSYSDPDKTHTYSSSGIYDVIITGFIEGFRFNNSGDKLKLTEISQWGNLKFGNSGYYFSGATNLVVTATDVPDLNGITNLAGTFSGYQNCSVSSPPNNGVFSWTNTSINNWDVSNVTNMAAMFRCTRFNQPLNNWDVSNVTDMSSMFYNNYSFNQNISMWDVSNVTNMNRMFQCFFSISDICFDQDISAWDVSNVTDMAHMFDYALSTVNYSNILIRWSNLTNLKSNVTLGATAVNYDSSAVDAKNILINNYNWTITDGGLE